MVMLDGKKIFFLMDSQGVALELINDYFREEGAAFNVVGFVEAALESKNFTYPTIKRRLITAMIFNKKVREDAERDLDIVARKKGWLK